MNSYIAPKLLLFFTSIFIYSLSLAQGSGRIDSLKKVLPTTESKEKVNVLRDLCYYGSFFDPNEAVEFGLEAVALAIKIGDKKGLCGAYNDLFGVYLKTGKMDSALDYAERALTIAREIKHKKGITSSLQNAGVAYTKKGNYSRALEYMFEALKLSESEEGTNLGYILGEISGVYVENKDYSKALEYQLLALKEQESFQNLLGLSAVYNNLAIIYKYLGEYNLTEEYLKKSVELNKKNNNTLDLATNYLNIGELYQVQNKNELALLWFNKSLELRQNSNFEKFLPHTLMKLAEIYLVLDDFKNAEYYAKKGLRIASKNGDDNIKLEIYKVLLETYQHFGQYAQSLDYSLLYTALKDSIYNESKETIIADLDTRYQTSKKEAENKLLIAESEKQAAEIKQRDQWVIMFSVGSGMLLLFFVILYIFYRQKIKINEQLKEQKIELMQLNKTKDRFFGIIAHDLRNPVVSFQGLSKLIQSYVKNGKIDRIESLSHKITHSVESLNRLLDNLLSWASSQAGTLPYHPQPLDIKQVLEECFSLFAETAFAKQIKLTDQIEGSPVVFADKNGVSTIFRNLVSNALKFTPEGGEISVSASVEEEQVKITISDSGVGMDQNKIQSLFQLSKNESSEGTGGEKGSGLGLILCKEFIVLNKGKIWVQSKINQGTQFHLVLPVNHA